MDVVNCTLYSDNPYQQAFYSALKGRYTAIKGTVDLALQRASQGEKIIFHVNWEEHLLRPCRTLVEAKAVAENFIWGTEELVRREVPIVWTIHNGMPHELEFPDIFIELRRHLARVSDRIIVHNTEAISILGSQAHISPHKIFYLPHPSYLSVYEPEAQAWSAEHAPDARGMLVFGKIRRYKGIGGLIQMLPEGFLSQIGAQLQICGSPIANDDYLAELQTEFQERTDIFWDIRNIPDADVPHLFRSARCIMLPYERFLTSGVALLAISMGSIIIGPVSRQLQEVIPRSAQRFLFEAGKGADLQRAVTDVFSLGEEELQSIRRDLLDRAEYLHPTRLSLGLGEIYDWVKERPKQPKAAS